MLKYKHECTNIQNTQTAQYYKQIAQKAQNTNKNTNRNTCFCIIQHTHINETANKNIKIYFKLKQKNATQIQKTNKIYKYKQYQK